MYVISHFESQHKKILSRMTGRYHAFNDLRADLMLAMQSRYMFRRVGDWYRREKLAGRTPSLRCLVQRNAILLKSHVIDAMHPWITRIR